MTEPLLTLIEEERFLNEFKSREKYSASDEKADKELREKIIQAIYFWENVRNKYLKNE